MLVRAARLRRALHGIGRIDRDDVLVDMILVHVVEMPVVQVVDVALVAYRRMPAVGTMLVGMIGMMLLGAGGHRHVRRLTEFPSNQALERTATRRVFKFYMIKTVSVEATLGVGGGRSAWSR